MSKLIVHNQTELSDDVAMIYVMSVLRNGFIPDVEKNYYVTNWEEGVTVSARKNKASYTFLVWRRDTV